MLALASLILFSIAQVTVSTMQQEGRRSTKESSNILERASGLVFLDPGWYDNVKLNLLKKSARPGPSSPQDICA